ncbi:MAG: hypothetical protein ISR83_00235 [Candidatus Marinimicrobia bacterium]|nr:hypothetical protein [Candidatus Neomarinimicrobiota bacterium]
MRVLYVALIIIVGLSIYSCDDSRYLVGSNNVIELENVIFTITEYSVEDSTRLNAKGTAKNTGPNTIYPTWYIEGHFYTDSTLAFKLGGDRQQKSISLEPGASLSWSLEYKSYEEGLSQYPKFRVSQLRAYQEHQDD